MIRAGKPRVAQDHPAPGGDAVGHVVEFFRLQLVEIAQHGLLEELRVQRGHAVDGMAADAGQMRHAHILLAALVDERQPRQTLVVPGKAHPHLVQKAPVDLVDDLQVPRQHVSEERQRPFFQGLRQQGVVGVGEGAPCDLPGLLPVHEMLVHQQPHQFRHGDGGVGVVELHGQRTRRRCPGVLPDSRWMRIMSCSEQETKKYCCARRSCFPWSGSSLG